MLRLTMSTRTRDSRAAQLTEHVDARRGDEPRGDRIYAELRERLISLRIAPGAPIDVTMASRELAVSRASVREAIKRLSADGLVVTLPRRGTFASEISVSDMSHICDVDSPSRGTPCTEQPSVALRSSETLVKHYGAGSRVVTGAI